jgi:hypothetical protein
LTGDSLYYFVSYEDGTEEWRPTPITRYTGTRVYFIQPHSVDRERHLPAADLALDGCAYHRGAARWFYTTDGMREKTKADADDAAKRMAEHEAFLSTPEGQEAQRRWKAEDEEFRAWREANPGNAFRMGVP